MSIYTPQNNQTTWKTENHLSENKNDEAPANDNQPKALSTLSRAGASLPITGRIIDASAELTKRTEEMKGMMERLKQSGVDTGPLRMCIWNYTRAFATYKILRVLKQGEMNASTIVNEKE